MLGLTTTYSFVTAPIKAYKNSSFRLDKFCQEPWLRRVVSQYCSYKAAPVPTPFVSLVSATADLRPKQCMILWVVEEAIPLEDVDK